MQIASTGDNLHEMPKHFGENLGKYINSSSAEGYVQSQVIQSIVSLTRSVNSLIVVAKVFSNTLIFLLQKCG